MPPVTRKDLDLSTMSLEALRELRDRLEVVIPERKRHLAGVVRARIAAEARAAGFSVDELFRQSEETITPQRAVGVKYRNPKNPTETWSGRGRRARWLVAALKQRGAKIEDFSV